MEIQKIFSDEYDNERLYSVLMSEEELYLFSEAEKKKKSKLKITGLTGIGLGAGSILGGVYNDLKSKTNEDLCQKLKESDLKKAEEALTKAQKYNKNSKLLKKIGLGAAVLGGLAYGIDKYKDKD